MSGHEDEVPGGAGDRVKVPLLLAGAAAWSWRLLLVGATGTMIVFVLIQLYVVVVPVILALFLAAALEPLVAKLRRHGWPPALAAAVVFFGTLAVLGLLFTWIGTQVAEELSDVGDRVDEGLDEVREWLQGDPFNLSPGRLSQLEEDLKGSLSSGGSGGAGVAKGARTVTEVFGGLVLMLFTLFFVLKDGFRMADWFKERIAPAQRDDAVEIAGRSRKIMRLYLIATGLTGLIDGILIAVALLLLGVPLVLPLAVLTFLGGFFPLVGATLAGLIAAMVALVDGGFTTALLVVGATILIQQIEGNLLQPLILERAVRLHPLVTVVAVGAGLLVGGLLGAFLSVPLVAIGAQTANYYRVRNQGEAEGGDQAVSGSGASGSSP